MFKSLFFSLQRMPVPLTVTVVLLSLCVLAPETSAQQLPPELREVNREFGSNVITLQCRMRMLDDTTALLQGAKFYVNETSQDLVTLLSVRGIAYTSEEGEIQFSLPQDLEANYLCGLNSTYVSATVPLLHYPRRDPIQQYYARATGTSLTMNCGVKQGALAGSYTVVWRRGFQIVDTSDPRFTLQRKTGEDYSLTISDLQISDSANYTCEVAVQFANAYHVPEAPVKLLVFAEPAITVRPVDTTSLAEDMTVSFTCEGTGYPSPDIQWYHNQNLVAQSRGSTTSSKYAINSTTLDSGGTVHSTLTIMNTLSLADSGEVICEVRVRYQDELREMQSPTMPATATLTVLDDSFGLHTIVTQGHDLQPQLTLSASLPSLTKLVLRYFPTDGSTAVDQSSTSAYFNVSKIIHFVPNSVIPPEMTTFRLQVALKVNGRTGPFAPQDISRASVIDINDPSDSEECADRISDTTIMIIVGSILGTIIVLGVLSTICVCCYVRNWGRIEKLPRVTEYRQQLSNERDKVMTDGNIPEEERQRRVEKLDKKIDKADRMIGRLASDSGRGPSEVETGLKVPGGMSREMSKLSSTEEAGEEVPMLHIKPEDKS